MISFLLKFRRLYVLETANLLGLLVFGVVVIERGNFTTVKYTHPIVAVKIDHPYKAMHLSLMKLPLEEGSKFTYVATNSMWLVVEDCPLVDALNFIYFYAKLFCPLQFSVVL